MTSVALVSLPVFNVAHCHLLVLTPKSKTDIIKFYNSFFGGAFVLYFQHIKNRVNVYNALVETFGSFPSGFTMMICGYDIPDIIQGIEAARDGKSINITQKHEVKYFSKELIEFVPHVKEDDNFFFGDDVDSYGVFPEEDLEDEVNAEDITEEELRSLEEDEDEECSEEVMKFKEIEKIMFSNMGF